MGIIFPTYGNCISHQWEFVFSLMRINFLTSENLISHR